MSSKLSQNANLLDPRMREYPAPKGKPGDALVLRASDYEQPPLSNGIAICAFWKEAQRLLFGVRDRENCIKRTINAWWVSFDCELK
jgi:hypothetical protein